MADVLDVKLALGSILFPVGPSQADELKRFLRELAAKPVKFGDCDCALALADWVRWQTGKDPAAHLRGRYHNNFGWKRIVVQSGGLINLIGDLAVDAGMQPTGDPQPGDIGVVGVKGLGPAGAIRTSRGWAMKLTDGLIVSPHPTLAAWSF